MVSVVYITVVRLVSDAVLFGLWLPSFSLLRRNSRSCLVLYRLLMLRVMVGRGMFMGKSMRAVNSWCNSVVDWGRIMVAEV